MPRAWRLFNNPSTSTKIDIQLFFFHKLEDLAKTQSGKIRHLRSAGWHGNHQVPETGLFRCDSINKYLLQRWQAFAGWRILARGQP